jgi:hypothetical protein
VEIYQVTDHDHQQRILKVFRELEHPSVVALGTQGGRDWFVVVEVRSIGDRIFVHQCVYALDPHAARTYSSGRPQLAGPISAS